MQARRARSEPQASEDRTDLRWSRRPSRRRVRTEPTARSAGHRASGRSPARAALRPRLAALDWARIEASLDGEGHARLPALLSAAECRALDALYVRPERFRKRVEMQAHGFGCGVYQYFAYPLPPLVAALRSALYPRLVPIADRWAERLGTPRRFPGSLARFRELCRRAGQAQPTPLLLRYAAGGYNRMHQDLYGELAFPLQLTVLLSDPGRDFEGGEFLLQEQRPRMQSRVEAISLSRGEGILFATRERPVPSARGHARAQLRHGVSRIRTGRRTALGVIFHDART